MDDLEVMAFVLFAALAVVGTIATGLGRLHPLHFRNNPAPGIARLGVLAAMGWIVYVLLFHADPSVRGVYVLFYLVMGYAVVKLCGQLMAGVFGARIRVDIGERRNVPGAVVVAAFTLATGLIFGGSLWGEADPVGDDEGGFWIPLSFFLLGWGVLLAAFFLFLQGEGDRLRRRIQRERNLEDARASGFFLFAAAIALTDAVAGDFWGWRHGLLTFGVLAGLLLVHQLFSNVARGEEEGASGRRAIESAVYLLLALSAWGANRLFDLVLGGG